MTTFIHTTLTGRAAEKAIEAEEAYLLQLEEDAFYADLASESGAGAGLGSPSTYANFSSDRERYEEYEHYGNVESDSPANYDDFL